MLLLCTAGSVVPALAQKDAPPKEIAAKATNSQPHTLDRVDAIVNQDVLLESDVEEEMSFAAFQPFSNQDNSGNQRQGAMQRLIDRDLVQEQLKMVSHPPVVGDEELDKQLTELRRSLPSCAKYNCSTDAGWTEFCAAHGFTPAQVRELWRQRMVLLAFIEGRFRTGIRISEAEIKTYYDKEFVPAFQDKRLSAPPLPRVHDRIQEILLQRRVTTLLNEWLSSLRDEGSVQILDPRDIPPEEAQTGDSNGEPAVNAPLPGSVPAKVATPATMVAPPKAPDVVPAGGAGADTSPNPQEKP